MDAPVVSLDQICYRRSPKTFYFISYNEFEDDPIVVPQGAPYFLASIVTGREVRDDPAFVTVSAYSPESSPLGRVDDGCTSSQQPVLIPSASYQHRLTLLLLESLFRSEQSFLTCTIDGASPRHESVSG